MRRTAQWEAHIGADRSYFDRGRADGMFFPAHVEERVVQLYGPRELIGRTRRSDGIFPKIDLSVPPEDPGVSTIHAILERQPNGAYCIVDRGSRNGTRLNDDPEPIKRDRRIPLQDGDRIFVGAWSRVTIRRAVAEPNVDADTDADADADADATADAVTIPREH